jgi:hypothetical protein
VSVNYQARKYAIHMGKRLQKLMPRQIPNTPPSLDRQEELGPVFPKWVR